METESMKKNQMETWALKSTVTQMKNSLQGFHGRFDLTEGGVMIIHSEEQKGKWVKANEQSLRDLWDTLNLHVRKSQSKEKREKRGRIFERCG